MDLDKYLDTDLKGRHDTQRDDIQHKNTQHGHYQHNTKETRQSA